MLRSELESIKIALNRLYTGTSLSQEDIVAIKKHVSNKAMFKEAEDLLDTIFEAMTEEDLRTAISLVASESCERYHNIYEGIQE